MGSLGADHLSSCIWSLGLIGYKLNPSTLEASNSDGKRIMKKTKRGSSQHYLTLSYTLSQSLIQYSTRSLVETGINVDVLCRVLTGLARMGCDWSCLPEETRAAVVDTLIKEPQVILLEETSPLMAVARISLFYATLWVSCGPRQVTFQPKRWWGLLVRLNSAFEERAMTPQGIVNSLNGLHKLGLRWKDDLGKLFPSLCDAVLMASTEAVGTMRKDELCSLLHSLASLKVIWSETLPPALQEGIVQSIRYHAPAFSNRDREYLLGFGQVALPVQCESQ